MRNLAFGYTVPLAGLALAILLSVGLVGCATMSAPQNQMVEQIAVQYATGKFIEAKAFPADRIERAAQVKSVAVAVKAVAASDNADIATLEALAMSRINTANLQPSDRLLAQALVAAVVTELSTRVANGALSASDRVLVTQMLDWVISACDAYAVSPGPG